MKKLLGFLIVILICAFGPINVGAQGYEEWTASVGDQGSHYESGYAITLDSEGNVYSAGNGKIGDWTGGIFVKYNGNTGAQEWVVQHPNINVDEFGRKSIIVDSGYVYIVGGWCMYGNPGIIAAKYDATTGIKQWDAWYQPQPHWVYAAFFNLAVDHQGNVYVGGYTSTTWVVVKYDSTGFQIWEAFHPYFYAVERAMAVDAAGDVYVTGQAYYGLVQKPWDFCTVKYDGETGNIVWRSTYNGPRENSIDISMDIAIDLDGNIYVTGLSQGQYYDFATVKYNPDGEELWVARFNGGGDDIAKKIAVDADGNVYVSGYSYEIGSGKNYLTIKYDRQGNEIWAARYTNLAFPDSEDEARSMALDPFGNVYITGISEESDSRFNLTTVKYNSSGEQQWVVRTGISNSPQYQVGSPDIAVNADGVYITGYAGIPNHRDRFVTIKYPLEIPNQPPVANAGPDQIIIDVDLSGSETVTFDGSASYDPDTDDTISYVWKKNWAIIGNEVSFNRGFAVGEHLVTLTVIDNVEANDTDTTTITILEGTPSGAIYDLISVIKDMNLQIGISNSLDRKLERIRASLDAIQAGNRQDAIQLLRSFILECEAQRGINLTYTQADYLIYRANLIIAFLGRE